MLAKVAGRPDQLVRKLQRQRNARIARIEMQFIGMALLDAFIRPTPHLAGERSGKVFRKAERLANFADGAPRAVAADDGGKRGMAAAIGLVDPLNDLFAPLMLEIDIDVGRLVAGIGNEALEQKLVGN